MFPELFPEVAVGIATVAENRTSCEPKRSFIVAAAAATGDDGGEVVLDENELDLERDRRSSSTWPRVRLGVFEMPKTLISSDSMLRSHRLFYVLLLLLVVPMTSKMMMVVTVAGTKIARWGKDVVCGAFATTLYPFLLFWGKIPPD